MSEDHKKAGFHKPRTVGSFLLRGLLGPYLAVSVNWGSFLRAPNFGKLPFFEAVTIRKTGLLLRNFN